MGSMLTKNLLYVDSKRQKMHKNPKDYGMDDFEEISFKSKDDIEIHGWLIKGEKEKPVVIVTHPMPMCRSGFDSKQQGLFKVTKLDVELLKTMQALHKEGYNVVCFDFRNHGKSGKANSGFTGIGIFEYNDVVGCLEYLKERKDTKDLEIGFASLCMGANSTIIALSKHKEAFSNVKCLFLIQPVSMKYLVPNMLASAYPMFKSCYDSMNKKAKGYTGVSLDEMSPLNYISSIDKPVCFSQVKVDPWTKPEDVQSFFDAVPKGVEKELIWIEGDDIKERFDGYNYYGNNPEKMIAFFKKHLN